MNDQQFDSRSIILQDKAGFWRRCFGLLLDSIIVSFPFQIVAILLFGVTGGLIQDQSGLGFTKCQPIAHLSITLNPPPPVESNFAKECRYYSFGFETARRLIIGRTTRDANVTHTVSQSYSIGTDGQQIGAFSLDAAAALILFIYLIAMQARFGATIGQRIVKIHVVRRDEPLREGISLKKAFVRNIVLLVGYMPPVFVLLLAFAMGGAHADAMFAGGFFQWFGASMLLCFIWELWILIQIVRREDAIHDRIAGTSVLRKF